MRPPFRIGLGFDTHRLGTGGPLRLGGVEIPFEQHLIGHSDADVLLHAITDALLGAVNLGDIGRLFPNTDPANKGRDSAEFLTAAAERVRKAGWEIGNLDCVVSAERPKLAPFVSQITARIAEILNVDAHEIGVKGKTGEQTGPVGHGEIIEARCVALIYRP